MKEYFVDVDITISKRYVVTAENEQRARELTEEKFNNPYDVINTDGCYVKHEITDVYE